MSLIPKPKGFESSDNQHRRIQYNICHAIDPIRVGIVLEEMERDGLLCAAQRVVLEQQAMALLAAIINENNRAHGVPLRKPL